MDLYKTTHETDWRRVRWVHDPEYTGLVDDIIEEDAEAKAAAQRELEDLHTGALLCLGAIIETKCPHCSEWTQVDALWNIIVGPADDLEELGSEILDIPEMPPTAYGCPNPEVLETMVNAGINAVVTEPEQERLPDWLAQDMGLPPGATIPRPPKGPPNTLEKEGDTTPRRPRGPGLARIVLQFDPDTFSGIRSAVFVRGLAGQSGGLVDAFMVKLIEKIEAGEATWEVKQKKAVD